jgi:N utilization substance protein A
MKGVRIQAIVRELNNEKIDIVNFSSEPTIFISRAMTPAKPIKVIVNDEEKMAVAIISDEEMALAIGKAGQNLRLASQLTGYQIEPVKESEYQAQVDQDYMALENITELPDSVMKKLQEADVRNKSEIIDLGLDGLMQIPGIGKKTAEKILDIVSKAEKSTEPLEEESLN